MSDNDFGQEAIDTILEAMSDRAGEFAVIVAGYPKEMQGFLNSNPGLQSRFNKYFYFEDYTGEQLMAIFRSQCEKNGYVPDEEAEKYAVELFNELYENRDDNFGNGRDVRNIFEDMVVRQADRVSTMENPTKDDLMAVKKEDFEDAE